MSEIEKIDEKLYGIQLCNHINSLIEQSNMTKTEFAESINKSPSGLNKLLYDLRQGKISLKNLLLLSQGLDIDLKTLFDMDGNCEDLFERVDVLEIHKLIDQRDEMDQFQLKDLLTDKWSDFTNGEKVRLGKWFYSEVIKESFPTVQYLMTKPNNHIVYRKCKRKVYGDAE